MASGMPCPRIFSEPKRAIRPMTSPPSAGASTIHQPALAPAREVNCVLNVWNQIRLEMNAIARNNIQAAATPPAPTTQAMATRTRTRPFVVKSPEPHLGAGGMRTMQGNLSSVRIPF